MGSTGSGNFSDYPGSRSESSAGGSGGSSGEDRCSRAFNCTLEEVEQCDYFSNHSDVPSVGTPLSLELRGRLMAVDSSGLSVGAIPTSFNYLADCLRDGFDYVGIVVSSTANPFASVNVDFAPKQK